MNFLLILIIIRPTLKNCFLITCILKKVTQVASITFFTLFKLNVTFCFKFYLHHKCSINLNWNNTQLCLSKPFFMCSNASIFSSLNLGCQLLFTTFTKQKNLFAISLGCRVDKQSSITRKIWENVSPAHWYKIDHMFDVVYFFMS